MYSFMLFYSTENIVNSNGCSNRRNEWQYLYESEIEKGYTKYEQLPYIKYS